MPDVKQQKFEPKVITGDLSSSEIIEWMEGKIAAARRLKSALAERESLRQALDNVNLEIDSLTNISAIEVFHK